MLVDYERAWREFQAEIRTKSGHGTFGPTGLLAKMAELEVNCKVEEPPTERSMRLFGVLLSEDLITAGQVTTETAPNGT